MGADSSAQPDEQEGKLLLLIVAKSLSVIYILRTNWHNNEVHSDT